jgi:probable DNA metabolism protein
MQVDLASPVDLFGFRSQANSMLAQQVPPEDVSWGAANSVVWGETVRGPASRPASLASALHSIVPRSFVRLTELVVLHRDAARFDLLYRLLWRLVHEPELAGSTGDTDMVVARSMAQAVRRDLSRTRRSVQLRALGPSDGVTLRLGWCEPQHHVTEEVAQWLVRTDPAGPWLLASPDRCVLWTSTQLLCGPGVPGIVAHRADDANWYRVAAELASGCSAVPAVA